MTQVLAHVARSVAGRDESLADLFARVKRWGNVRPLPPSVEQAVIRSYIESQRVALGTKEARRAVKGGRR